MDCKAILVSGFLGSGKTTFILESLLPCFKREQVAILVNDYGEISFDKLKYYERQFQVLGIEGSCICCSAGHTFLKTLKEIKSKYKTIIIETSGVSQIDPIYEAIESEGITLEASFTTLNLDLPQPLFYSPYIQDLIGSAQVLILTKADLLPNGAFKEKISLISKYKKPYFIAYEGKIKEDLREILKLDLEKPQRIISSKAKYFHKATFKPTGFYSRIEVEKFLKDLPSEIYRVKGVLSCVESPIPLALNYSFGYVSWERLETLSSNFLVFIGTIDPTPIFKDFPKPIRRVGEFERRMLPLGSFDKREGIAYFEGKAISEVRAVKNFNALLKNKRDWLLITKKGEKIPSIIKKQTYILENYSFSSLLELKENIEKLSKELLIFIGVPSGIVSWFLEGFLHRKIIHFGKTYLLPPAYLSLKINSTTKKRAILNLLKRSLAN